jgi:hypothetical protein
MSFETIAIGAQSGEKVFLKTLSDDKKSDSTFWIIPKKLDRNSSNKVNQIWQRIMKKYGVDPDPDRSDEDTKKLMAAKAKAGQIEGSEKDDEELTSIYFLNGVAEHNLDKDDGKLFVFNDETLKLFKAKYDMVLSEIAGIVREWQEELTKLLSKKNETLETPLNGDTKE